jgi:hypothetical protein
MACERLRDGLRQTDDVPMELMADVAPEVDAATAIRLMLGRLGGERIAAGPNPHAIELLGWLELPLDDAPALAVTGLHEGAMPQSLNADLFLPNRLRRALGIVDNDRRYARDAYALSLLAASREELGVIIGRRAADRTPLVPSRLLFACREAMLPERARRLFGDGPDRREPASASDAAATASTVADPESSPVGLAVPLPEPLPEPVESMRVTEFRDYLACPYRYYLRHRLKLAAVDDAAEEMDGAAFGTLAHNVLRAFAKSEAVDSTDAERIEAELSAALDRLARSAFGRDPLPAVRVQIEQLRRRLAALAQWQAGWAVEGWRIEHAEVAPPQGSASLMVDGRPMLLTGRMDRIDINDDTGERIIFDYKTSDTADPPEKTHRKSGEWIDLQLPLYRHLAAGLGIEGPVRLGYIVLPKSTDKVGALLAEWTDDDLREATEVAEAVVRTVRQEKFWPPETLPPSFSEAYAPICQDGQLGVRLAGAESDDVEE